MPLLFAYGSNMDIAAMAERCPASRPLGQARLARHRLVIMREGYVSVVRDPRRAVYGLLWEVALADMAALDRYECVAAGLYTKRQLPVVTERGPRGALVYLGANAGPGTPQPGYLEIVLRAGREAGLPQRHLAEIEALGARSGSVSSAPRPARLLPTVRPTSATPFARAASGPDNRGWTWRP